MTNTTISRISPQEAKQKMEAGATLLDVREAFEWQQSHIPGAILLPLADLKTQPECAVLSSEILLLCRSGRRAEEAAHVLAKSGQVRPVIVEGGLQSWKKAGLPVQDSNDGAISMERQVRIGAGALVLLGLLVPRLRALSFFVSGGLIFAGITDWCGMAKVLAKAPWNRR